MSGDLFLWEDMVMLTYDQHDHLPELQVLLPNQGVRDVYEEMGR